MIDEGAVLFNLEGCHPERHGNCSKSDIVITFRYNPSHPEYKY